MRQYNSVIIPILCASLLMRPACSSAPKGETAPAVQSGAAEIVAPASLEGALVAIPTTVDGKTLLRHIYIHGGKAYVHEGTWDEKEKFVKECLAEELPLPKPSIPKKLPPKPNKLSFNERYEWYVDSSNQAWSLAESDNGYPSCFKYIPHGKKAEIYIVFSGRRYSMISAKGGDTTPATFELTAKNGNVYSGRFINAHICWPDFEGVPDMYDSPLTTITIYANESATAPAQQKMPKEYKDAAEIAQKVRKAMEAVKQDLEKQQETPDDAISATLKAEEMVKQGYQELQRLAASASQQVSDFAPVSVKGKTIVFDQRNVLSRSGDDSGARSPWKADSKGIESISFKKGNSFTKKPDHPDELPSYWRDKVSYTKTGPNAATVRLEYFEAETIYTMTFTSASSGTLSVSESGEATVVEWKGGTFTIK